MKLIQKISLLFILFATFSVGATTITIVNNDGAGEGLNDATSVSPVSGNAGTTLGQQYLNVFKAAADYWETKLDSSVPILVGTNFDPLECTNTGALLGSAGPEFVFFDFPNAPISNTWFTSAHADSLAGSNGAPGSVDLSATFNSNLNGNSACLGGTKWWLGIGASAPGGTISLFDTVLHEIGHGLGFLALVDQSGARFGNRNDIFMYNLFDQSQGKFWRNMTNAQRATSAVNTDELVWRGSNVTNNTGFINSGKNGGFLSMYTPNPYEGGSSVSHWNTSVAPDELMEPFATAKSFSCATLLAFKDMFWNTINECDDVPTTSFLSSLFLLLFDD